MDRQFAGVENQLVAGNPIEKYGGNSFDDFPVELHAQVEIEVPDADPIGACIRMNIHTLHDRIQTSHPPSFQREGLIEIAYVCQIRNRSASWLLSAIYSFPLN